jgi:hypothetical protein
VAKRARHAAKRHHPGEAGVGASEACAPGAERKKFSPLIFYGIIQNSEVKIFHLLLVCNGSESERC